MHFLIISFLLAAVFAALKIAVEKLYRDKYRASFFDGIVVGNAQLIGQKEKQNDYFEVVQKNGALLAAIANGATQKRAGKFAAVVTVETLKANFLSGIYEQRGAKEYFEKSFAMINKTLSDNASGNKLASALVAAIIDRGVLRYVSIGDDSIIVYHGGELFNVRGAKEPGKMALHGEDVVMLCSSGARNSLTEPEIISELSRRRTHPYEKCMHFSKRIQNKKFNHQDNATIIVLENLTGRKKNRARFTVLPRSRASAPGGESV